MPTLQACATSIHEACDTNTLQRCYAVAQELRPHLSATQFVDPNLGHLPQFFASIANFYRGNRIGNDAEYKCRPEQENRH